MRPSGGIVMVAYTDYPWDPRVRREAESLVNRGHAVTVVCCREAGQVPRETVAGVTVDRVPLSMRRGGPTRYLYQYLVFLIMAALRIRRLRPAAVHLHSVPDFVVFAATGPRLRGVPVTLDLHEAMPEMVLARFPRSRAIVRLALAAERLSCRFANRVIVVNETIRDLIGGRSVPADRITVLYNSPVVSAGETLIPSEPTAGMLHLVYAGSIDRERDLETLVRAIGELRSTLPTSLILYGRGDPTYRAYLEGLVSGLELKESVSFGGVLPGERVLAHLARSDLGVVTYVRSPLTEVALPNKVFEYIAVDKPLVLPDLRAMRRTFDGAAWFYEPANPRDLAAKIREAADASAESDSRRRKARVVYEAARWEAQAERLAAMYPIAKTRVAQLGGRAACT